MVVMVDASFLTAHYADPKRQESPATKEANE
jgi:hypothetical protein